MATTPPPSPAACRADAVALVRTSGHGLPRLASELGVAEQALCGGVKRAEIDAGRGQPGALTTAEREELRRLRREVTVLQQERAIRRTAAASFAREI